MFGFRGVSVLFFVFFEFVCSGFRVYRAEAVAFRV